MPDEEADTATDDAPIDEPEDDSTDWKAEAQKYQALHRKQEERAKANHAAARELEQLKRSSMSELEKAVAEARDEGKALGVKEAVAELVDAKIEAAASGRLDPKQLAELLDGIDRSKFVNADGKVDAAKVTKFVEAVAPAKGTVDLGQGPRGSAGSGSMNDLLRSATGR